MSGLLGQKIGMSQIIGENGKISPVTYVQIEPNTITQVKTEEKDGYSAIVVGYEPLKNPSKTKQYRHKREFRLKNQENEYKIGDTLTVELLQDIEKVHVTSYSKGKGFQGVMRRYGFGGGPASHGSHHKRKPGSVGGCAKPGKILKGQKLPGRQGNQRTTMQNRNVAVIDVENNIVGIVGPVPGSFRSLIYISPP
jgi:large subunit ribosomal protein L3